MESSKESSSGSGAKQVGTSDEKISKTGGSGGQRPPPSSRLHRPTAASEAKSKSVAPEPRVPGLRQPIRPLHGARPQPLKLPALPKLPPPAARRGMQTPTSKPSGRVISTPTNDEVTASDITLEAWDASEIHAVNRTQAGNMNTVLEETVVPICKLGFDACKTAVQNRGGRKPPAAAATAVKIKPPLFSAMKQPPSTIAKISNRQQPPAESEDPEDISEELLDLAYCRYIQAKYIETMSKKAYNQTLEDCESGLLAVWSLLEQTRQEYIRSEMEGQRLEVLAEVQALLSKVEAGVDTASAASGTILCQLEALAQGLGTLKHNLPVSGAKVDDGPGTIEALEKLSKEYNSALGQLADISSAEIASSAAQMCDEMAGSAGQCLLLAQACDSLLIKCESLVIREASLNMSHSQLEEARAKASKQTRTLHQ